MMVLGESQDIIRTGYDSVDDIAMWRRKRRTVLIEAQKLRRRFRVPKGWGQCLATRRGNDASPLYLLL